jgi:hypothetical protein
LAVIILVSKFVDFLKIAAKLLLFSQKKKKRQLFDGIEQSLAGIFQQFDDQFEGIVVAIIRVGDAFVHGVMGEVVGHADNLPKVVGTPCKGSEMVDIFAVHAHNQVKLVEVGCGKLPCYTVELIAVPPAMSAHALVGQLPHMPWPQPSGVYLGDVLQFLGLEQVSHDAFGSRRAADVAQTNEEYSLFSKIWFFHQMFRSLGVGEFGSSGV